jgi:MinD-like ATPase involved in chromosome partitioning or flagellar assembly
MSERSQFPWIVTFYSYKGGVGRTMALVNVAHLLAKQGWRVLMVDFDLEAPGMTHFFSQRLGEKRGEVRRDAVDLLLRAKRSFPKEEVGGEDFVANSLAGFTVDVGDFYLRHDSLPTYLSGRLDLLPATLESPPVAAGPTSSLDYLQRIDDLNLPWIFSAAGPQHKFGDFLRQYFKAARFSSPGELLSTMREVVRTAYDVVFIDSRTGLNEVSGLSIGPLCDQIVLCTGLNKQNQAGTRYFMQKTGLLGENPKPFMVLVGPVPPWSTGDAEKRLAELRKFVGMAPLFEIPYHPRAALEECVFVEQYPRDEISYSYSKIAATLGRIIEREAGRAVDRREERVVSEVRRIRDESVAYESTAVRAIADNLQLLRVKRLETYRLGEPAPLVPSFRFARTPTLFTMEAATMYAGRREAVKDSASYSLLRAIVAAVVARRLNSRRAFDIAIKESCFDKPNRRIFLHYFQLRESTNEDLRDQVAAIKGDIKLALAEATTAADQFNAAICAYRFAARIHRGFEKEIQLPKVMDDIKKKMFDDPWLPWLFARGKSDRSVGEGSIGELAVWLEEDSKASVDNVKKLAGSWSHAQLRQRLSFARHQYGLGRSSLLVFPETTLAMAVAVAKGAQGIPEVLDLLEACQRQFGYSWQVLVNWKHFDELADDRAIAGLMSFENERTNVIEAEIDKGFLSL